METCFKSLGHIIKSRTVESHRTLFKFLWKDHRVFPVAAPFYISISIHSTSQPKFVTFPIFHYSRSLQYRVIPLYGFDFNFSNN